MFQTFEAPAAAAGSTGQRLADLRARMAKLELDGWLVPRADEHQGEYVPPSAERLRWLTGFTGSAGMAVVTRNKAALFIDGRYTVQSRQQVDTTLFEIRQVPEAKLSDWLAANLSAKAVVGFDPWLHTLFEIESRRAELAGKGILLKPVRRSPLDAGWGEARPQPPTAPVRPHPARLAGRSAADKIAVIQKQLADAGEAAVVLTLPDSIAWLLNIRGRDVAHNPVALAYAIVPRKGSVELFVDPAKIGDEVRGHLGPVARVATGNDRRTPAQRLVARLRQLARDSEAKVRIDPATAAFAVFAQVGKSKVARGKDPCIEPKAIKNAAEIKGARAAQERDGAAMVRFLTWLDEAAAKGGLTEIDAVRQLEAFRRDTGVLEEISFDTISGSGPNGAIVHYRVTEASNRKLGKGELFLVDSGAQYRDGTTDITRTVAIGRPTAEMRVRYTLVLKGHIAIASARFPKGTRGIDLDPFARWPLWQHGLDFDHGTGHGVGSYLSVHEGPQSISRRGMAVLEPGMIVSNEPGYYREGHYGIRIENLVLVTAAEPIAGGDRTMLGFETLTLCPYDRRLIEVGLLTPDERAWVDGYHARVARTLSPQVTGAARSWLAAATRRL